MIKRPLIATLLLTGVTCYFVISPEKKIKPETHVNMTPASDLKQLAKPSTTVNPPHGQPGHRCDIPVGSPIDASGKPGSPQPSFKPILPAVNAPVKTQSSEIAVKPAVQINPPHGQPGHRCDVKTGDPLPPTGSSIAPEASVSKQSSTVVPASTTARLNPAHGEPGHRCDIQVGAPLPAS